MKVFTVSLLLIIAAATSHAGTFYVSTSGNDSAAGTTATTAWATFTHAFAVMQPGDTLIVGDGTYNQQVCPVRSGTAASPITIKAANDGKAIIDGQNARSPVIALGGYCAGWAPISYVTIEGLVALNAAYMAAINNGNVIDITNGSNNNILRRVSGYNADKDYNSTVFVVSGSDNLIEDCVAGGFGRKMLVLYHYDPTVPRRNIVRRFFSAWSEWQGAAFNPGPWPWGDGVEIYGSSSNIIENSIAYGMAPGPDPGFGSNNQSVSDTVKNIAFIGDMAARIGMKWNGQSMAWPCPDPYDSTRGCAILPDIRTGFALNAGLYDHVLYQDDFAWGNGGDGLALEIAGSTNFSMVRGTFLNNGIGSGGTGVDITSSSLSHLDTISDSFIEGTSYQGGGAQLNYRYESSFSNDVPVPNLTSNPLWPWPMESRVKSEFATYLYPKWGSINPELQNFSVTATMQGIFNSLPSANNPLRSSSGGSSSGGGDTQAPSVPTNLTATAVSSSQINLTWTASTDNVGVTGYRIYRNGTQVATSTTASYSNTGLTPSTAYSFTVAAYDAAGNVSGQSTAANATTQAATDTQAPSVPTNLTAAVISSSQINLTWTASTDNVGVTGYRIYRNGTQVGTSTTTSYSNTGLTASTSYSFTVAAYDAAGNVSAQSSAVNASTQTAADTLAPSVSVTSPTTGASVSGTITATASATDNVGVVGVQFLVDGANLGAEDTASPYTISWNTTSVANGTHTLTARARDAAGNTTVSTAVSVTVSNTSQGSLSVANISDNRSSYANSQVPRYSKLELTFQVANTVATNLQLPYDPAPPPGIDPANYPLHKGISVDALFSPDNWATTYRQPAFYYQVYQDDVKGSWDGQNRGWFYPNGYAWKARFSPDRVGTWQYKIVARDASGTTESAVQSFTVAASSSHGFLRVSQQDPRYFAFDDGTPFYTAASNNTFSIANPVLENEPIFSSLAQNKMNFQRIWISSLYGSAWLQWVGGRNLYDGYLPRAGLEPFHDPVSGKDQMTQVLMYNDPTGWYDPCRLEFWDDPEAVKQNTNYRLQITYWGTNIAGPRLAGLPFGVVGKMTIDQVPNCQEPGVGTVITSYGNNSSNWSTVQGTWNSGSYNFVPRIYLALENATQGKVYISSVSLREDLGNGQYGPEIIKQPSMQYELYFAQEPSYAFDKIVELAEKYGVYLKLVLSDKDDKIYSKLDDDGTFVIGGEPDNSDGFYGLGRTMNKTRWLQQAWWRYAQARWGYSTAIHSWELTNEGDPYLTTHWQLTDEFGKFMRCRVFGISVASGDAATCANSQPNRHMATTSFWSGFPGYAASTGSGFWGNPSYPNVDYADLHAYISTSEAPLADRTAMQSDSAYYHLWHSSQYRSWNLSMPIVRGEGGMDLATQHATSVPGLYNDIQGQWYHDYLWSGVDSGGLYEMYWWYKPDIYNPGVYDHRPIARLVSNFLNGLPLNNGNYRDIAAQVSDTNLRVVGQKDLVNGKAHLWIQNKNHTWSNVVNGVSITPITGTVQIPGFAAGRTYGVEWWDTYTTASPVMFTQSIVASANGTLTLPVNSLTSDIGARITSSTGQTNTAPVVSAGPDLATMLGTPITVTGSATDDGLPAALTIAWSKVSGPGTVTFGSPAAATTTASFSAAGSYVIRLTASDSVLSTSDDATIIVSATNSALSPPTGLTGLYSQAPASDWNACDLSQNGSVNVVDVQLVANMTLGTIPCSSAITGLLSCTATTYQRVVSAALDQGCQVDPISGPNAVTLTWTPSSSTGVAGYKVFRSSVSGGPYTLVSPTAVPVLKYVDITMGSGRTYYYVIAAVDASDKISAYSGQATAIVP